MQRAYTTFGTSEVNGNQTLGTRDPTANDTSYEIGHRWVNTNTPEEFILESFFSTSLVKQSVWVPLGTGVDVLSQFTPSSGTVVTPIQGNVNINGISGITVTGSTETLTIASTSGVIWTEVTVTTQEMLVGTGYILNNVALVTATLPLTASVGAVMRLAGKGSGGWLLAQNAGQTVHFGDVETTTGAGGSIASTNLRDAIEILCTTEDTDFMILSSQGALLIS